MSGQQFFLGRQPIMGRQRELVAYELLFRAGAENVAVVHDDVEASAVVIQRVFIDLGMRAALGDKAGFINLSAELLMSDLIEMLPRDQVVLEILETVELTQPVIARCRALHAAGYRLALDDVTELTEARKTLLPFITYVKVDVLGMAAVQLADIVGTLRSYRVILLAEKVDNQAQYDSCLALGFHLFQGYFFAKPLILTGRALPPSAAVLMKLFVLTARDAEIEEIESLLKQAPDVTVRLLKMVNSAALSPLKKISGVRNAVLVLGRVQINRMAQIMMFAQRAGAGATADPLLQTAVIRGRVMERMAVAAGAPALKDGAFMVGMLSLADALFGMALEAIIEPLNLEDCVAAALLRREGTLGLLLQLAQAIETGDRPAAQRAMAELGLTDFAQVNQAQIEALTFAGRL